MKRAYFDRSLPDFAAFLLSQGLSRPALASGIFLRDATGRLTYVVLDKQPDSEARSRLSLAAAQALAPYVSDDGFAIATPEELFDEGLRDASMGWAHAVIVDGELLNVRLVDRRVVGIDWLQVPSDLSVKPRLVFASLKGGVGRSTALCVVAADLAARGLRVLAVDMDVEAPGLGSMLLTPKTTPRFGLLDYLVETSLAKVDDVFIDDLISASWLTGGTGIVSVLPALGAETLANPENTLAKLGRAYLDHSDDGTGSFVRRMQTLLDGLDARGDFDVILIDARAGLHETTGAAILGFGGKVLLFGINQPQTFDAYRLLAANLALLGPVAWDERLSIVHAKASSEPSDQDFFAKRFREMLAETLSKQSGPENASPDLVALRDVFEIEWEDREDVITDRIENVLSSGENYPVWPILENEAFREFDPYKRPEHLTNYVYDSVYGPLIAGVSEMLGLNRAEALGG